MLVGVVIAMRIRPRRPILLGVCLTFPLALAPFLLAIHAPVIVVAAGAFVGGAAIDIFGVLWDTTMQRSVPEEVLSRISSYDALGSLLLGPVGLIVAGPLITGLGTTSALMIASVSVVVPTALALLAPGVRHMHLPSAAAPPDAVPVPAAPALAQPAVVVAG
jgi:hypothetical protein